MNRPLGMSGSAAVPSRPASSPSASRPRWPLEVARLKCSFRRNRMSQGDSNPAAVPHAAEDIQGDDRWMSQVRLGEAPLGRGWIPLAGRLAGRGGCWASAARAPSGHASDPGAVTALPPQSRRALGTCLPCDDEARQEAASLQDPKGVKPFQKALRPARELGEIAGPFVKHSAERRFPARVFARE